MKSATLFYTCLTLIATSLLLVSHAADARVTSQSIGQAVGTGIQFGEYPDPQQLLNPAKTNCTKHAFLFLKKCIDDAYNGTSTMGDVNDCKRVYKMITKTCDDMPSFVSDI